MNSNGNKGNIYYVYVYYRENGTPYYVGKGHGKRAYKKSKKLVDLPPKELIVIVDENLSESSAFEKERQLISFWGRLDNNTGILENKTNGGDGSSGHIPLKRFYINNGKESKRILLEEKIPEGWSKGRLGSSNLGMYLINNGTEELYIKLDEPIPAGWVKGRLWRHSKEARKAIAEGNSKWRWITKGTERRRILKTDEIPEGWTHNEKYATKNKGLRNKIKSGEITRDYYSNLVKKSWETRKRNGRASPSEETKRKISEAHKGQKRNFSEQAKKNIYEASQRRIGIPGKKRTEDWKREQSIRITKWHVKRKNRKSSGVDLEKFLNP